MIRGSRSKIYGKMKSIKNGGNGGAGDNVSGRGYGMFYEESIGRDSGIIEMVVTETWYKHMTTTLLKVSRLWRMMKL